MELKQGTETVKVLYNVSKLNRSRGDTKTVYRVAMGTDGHPMATVDVPFDDFVMKEGDEDGAKKRADYIASLEDKAVQAALAKVFPGAPAKAAAPAEKADKDKK
jgi:hypothetical protein